MRYIKYFLITALVSNLVSCAHIYGEHGAIKDHNNDYLQAKSIPPLMIPPGYASSSIHASYPVSDRVDPEIAKKVNLVPPELNNS